MCHFHIILVSVRVVISLNGPTARSSSGRREKISMMYIQHIMYPIESCKREKGLTEIAKPHTREAKPAQSYNGTEYYRHY